MLIEQLDQLLRDTPDQLWSNRDWANLFWSVWTPFSALRATSSG